MNHDVDTNRNKGFVWSLTFLALIPFILFALLSIINFEYVKEVLVREAPLVGVIPCGWIVLAIIAFLIILTRIVLWLATIFTWKPAQFGMGFIAVLLILLSCFLVLIGPAMFQVLRTEAMRSLTG